MHHFRLVSLHVIIIITLSILLGTILKPKFLNKHRIRENCKDTKHKS